MKKQAPLVILVLVAFSAVAGAQAPGAAAAGAPVSPATPSPTPSLNPAGERAEAMRRLRALPPAERQKAMRAEMERRRAMRGQAGAPQAGALAKAAVVPRENSTQVQVVSVDTTAGTMTFNDVEGETNTWQFEPAGIARDPLLKPGARVTIIWKSDKTGLPIPTILGVVAFTAPSPRRPSYGQRPEMDGRPGGPQRRPSPSPPASPTPASPPPG